LCNILTLYNRKQNVQFPKTIEQLRGKYDIIRNAQQGVYYEDLFNEGATIARKQQILSDQAFTIRRNDDTEFDQSPSLIEYDNKIEHRQNSLMKVFSLVKK
jgi:hypothetical protein